MIIILGILIIIMSVLVTIGAVWWENNRNNEEINGYGMFVIFYYIGFGIFLLIVLMNIF